MNNQVYYLEILLSLFEKKLLKIFLSFTRMENIVQTLLEKKAIQRAYGGLLD